MAARAPASVPPDSFFFCHCHSPSLFFSRQFDDEVHHLLNICTKRWLGCGDGNCNICKCNVLQASSARANDNVIDLFALRFVFCTKSKRQQRLFGSSCWWCHSVRPAFLLTPKTFTPLLVTGQCLTWGGSGSKVYLDMLQLLSLSDLTRSGPNIPAVDPMEGGDFFWTIFVLMNLPSYLQ